MLEFYLACNRTAAGGAPIVGISPVVSIDADDGQASGPVLEGGYRLHRYVVRPYGISGELKASVGIWEITGECRYSGMAVSATELRGVEFEGYGALGAAERVQANGTYTAVLGSNGEYQATSSTNSYRFVSDASKATWGMGSFSVTTANALVLDHRLLAGFASAANVYLKTSGGSVTAQSSIDCATWVAAGSVTGTGTITLASAGQKCVRLVATTGTVEVQRYKLTARLASAPGVALVGNEYLLVQRSTGLAVTLSLGDGTGTKPVFGPYAGTLPVFAKASSAVAAAQANAQPEIPRFMSATFTPSSVAFAAGDTTELSLQHAVTPNRQQSVMLTLESAGQIVANAELFIPPVYPLLDATYGELLRDGGSSAPSLWWCHGTYKVSKTRPVPQRSGSAIRYGLSRNEKEAFQLVLRASSARDVVISRVDLGTLTGPGGATLPSSQLTVRRVEYVPVSIPTDNMGLAESWPDPIVPLELPYTCPAGRNCPLWVLAGADSTTVPGTYRGTITLIADSQTLNASVELRVFNATIPRHTRFRSLWGIEPGDGWRYHNVVSDVDKEKTWEEYLKTYAAHRMAPNEIELSHPYTASLIVVNGTIHWNFNWADFDAHVPHFFGEDGYGFNTMRIGLAGMNGGSEGEQVIGDINGNKWGTVEHTRLFTEFAQTLQNHLDSLGLIDRTVLYWHDEPFASVFPFVLDGGQAVHKAAPKIKVLITTPANPALYGGVDIWCPMQGYYESRPAHARQAVGEHSWTYLCCCPYAPHLGLFIDRAAVELRLWHWLMFSENIEGSLTWLTNYWKDADLATLQDPYDDPMSWWGGNPGTNGDGRLLYPPFHWKNGQVDTKPVDSIRWEMLRDGIEDWDLLTSLRETVPLMSAAQRERAEQLLYVPATMITYEDTEYSLDPKELLARRDAIAELIEEFNRGDGSSTRASSSSQGVSSNKQDHSDSGRRSSSPATITSRALLNGCCPSLLLLIAIILNG